MFQREFCISWLSYAVVPPLVKQNYGIDTLLLKVVTFGVSWEMIQSFRICAYNVSHICNLLM